MGCEGKPRRERTKSNFGRPEEDQPVRQRYRWAPGAEDSECLGQLQRLDVGSLKALRTALRVEADFLVLSQRLESVARDFREMREQICAARVRSDKSKTLAFVEPLDRTGIRIKSLDKT